MDMKRREVITFLGGAAVAWPLAAGARDRMRRIGVLKNTAESDAEAKVELAALVQELNYINRWQLLLSVDLLSPCRCC